MSNVAKLKKQAAELELKKQFDKALVVYVKLLENFDQYAAELDVALFNRVGDLLLRQGNVADAVDYYEQAVDRYAESGFFNNAIALCNKILRHSPGRASVYYKLGKISAQKGFKNDAKHNFLEYADRMQKAGRTDEAFRALTEFADLCPDQDDIRLMLADQLAKANRKDDALEQLQILYSRYQSEGRSAEASAAADRMRAIDPHVQLRSSYAGSASVSTDLIFIDLDDTPRPTPKPIRRTSEPVAPPPPPPQRAPTAPAEEPIALLAENDATAIDVPRVADLMLTAETAADDGVAVQQVADLESSLLENTAETEVEPLPDVERVVVDESEVDAVESLSDLDRDVADESLEVAATDLLLGLETTDTFSSHRTPAGPPSPSPKEETVDSGLSVGEDMVQIPDFDFLVREPELDPGNATEAAPQDYLANDIEITNDLDLRRSSGFDSPATSADSTPAVTPTPIESLPFLSRPTPVDSADAAPTDARQAPFGATGADDLLTTTEDGSDVDGEAEPRLAEIDLRIDSIENEAGASEGVASEKDSVIGEEETVEIPTPSFARRATIVAVQSVEMLKARIEGEPENWSRHRDLAEAMLEAGDRAGGLQELATAMAGAERSSDLDLASAIADEIARLEPEVVRHHQKRVEYAFRMNDRSRLIEAYVSLGDSLSRTGQVDKARTVYQRVLDLAPDDIRAQSAMDAIEPAETTPTASITPTAPEPVAAPSPRRRATPIEPPRRVRSPSSDSFVHLGDLLREDEKPKDLRMVVEEKEPSGDEAADFAEMLRRFKQGVAENVEPEDYQSHYDLAIAYKEMGLIDEAIAEFQKALAGPANRLATFEALGQCFVDKGQFKMAASVLTRALSERDATEEKLVGVLYLLGRVTEVQGRTEDALNYYHRVFVVDIEFRDIADRISELERAAR
jgi:tetratricopeptide (TPR) repeat protein